MSRYGDKHVIARGVILWDGVTKSELKDDGKGGKRTQYSLKIALMNTQVEVGEISAIATDALNADTTFRGRLPAGGCWPILPIDATDFEGRLPQHVAFNAKTYRPVQVFDTNNQEIPPQIYMPMLYPGCVVEVLVSAFAFQNVSKGIALSLDGVKIIDASAPRLPVGGVDATAAFAGVPPAGPQGGYTPTPGMTPGQPSGYVPPAAPGQPSGYTPPPTVQPAPDFLNPPVGVGMPPVPGAVPPPVMPVRQMTAKAAGQSYDAFRQAGWTDDQLIQNGYMTA